MNHLRSSQTSHSSVGEALSFSQTVPGAAIGGGITYTEGEISWFSATIQLIVRGLGREALNQYSNDDEEISSKQVGRTKQYPTNGFHSFVEKLMNNLYVDDDDVNEVIDLSLDFFRLQANVKSRKYERQNEDASLCVDYLIEHFWPKLRVCQVTKLTNQVPGTEQFKETICIPTKRVAEQTSKKVTYTYKHIRDFASAMESFVRLRHLDDIETIHFENGDGISHTVGPYFLVKLQRITVLPDKSKVKDTTGVAGVEVIKIYNSNRDPSYGVLQSFMVDVGECPPICLVCDYVACLLFLITSK